MDQSKIPESSVVIIQEATKPARGRGSHLAYIVTEEGPPPQPHAQIPGRTFPYPYDSMPHRTKQKSRPVKLLPDPTAAC